MAKRHSMYGKKRKINYGRIIVLLAVLAALVFAVYSFFSTQDYQEKIDEVMSSQILKISGTISSVSFVDPTVYSNEGIRYTSQHEKVKKLNSFDGTLSDDLDKVGVAKLLLENLADADEAAKVKELSKKDDGYYWLDVSVVVENSFLIFENEDEYNFDLYYDIEAETIYVKEKYHNEFSTKNNRLDLQGYEADEEFVKLIKELAEQQ